MSDQTFDAPVWHHGKALRKGYTTGSCATAAAKVAALMVMRQHLIHQVSIVTPSGVTLCLNVESPHVEGQQAVAAIRKNGGDDVDATHGMLIFARVTLNDSGEISLQGGEGIGTVTRKGIGLPTGSPAINRTPRHTIETAVREAIGPSAQLEIFTQALPRAKTYNAGWDPRQDLDYRHHGDRYPDVGRELEALALPRAGDKTRRRAGARGAGARQPR